MSGRLISLKKIMNTSLNKRHIFHGFYVFPQMFSFFIFFFFRCFLHPQTNRTGGLTLIWVFWTLAWCKLCCPCNPIHGIFIFVLMKSQLIGCYNSQCFPFNPFNNEPFATKNIFDLQLKTLVSCKNSSNPLNNSFLGCFNGNLWLNVITVIHIKSINKSQFSLQPIQWSFISYLFGWFHPNFSWVKPPMFPIHAKIPILDGQITYSWMKWRFNPDVPFGSIES